MEGALIAALKLAPRSAWEKFFDTEIQQLAISISGTAETDLLALKEKVRAMQAFKNKFLEAYDTPMQK